jgi:CheY-like chemotaxis protein
MLIADDDPAIVRLLADRCAKMGFDVETATNGIQALVKANRSHPDVLIVDVNMPHIDGLTLCKRLLEPANRPLNVVVITGSRDLETEKRCDGMGTIYVFKGNAFWNDFSSALGTLFPSMADSINEQAMQTVHIDVHERPRVLLIDDDTSIELFFSSRLGKCGVELLYATDAIQGYRMACREEPSIIVSDYHMPNGGASYLLWRLRTTPGTESIPVYILSGRRLDEVTVSNLRREICGWPGASRVFSKSFDTDALFAALQEFCGFTKH